MYFLSNTLSSFLPFVTRNRGITWQTLLFLPHCRACHRANGEKLHVNMFKISLKFPSPASTRSRRTGFDATHQTQYNTRRPFCGQFVYWCLRFRLWYGPLRTHTSYLLINYYLWCRLYSRKVSYRYHAIHRMIGIETSLNYSRHWHQYISKLSHDTYAVIFRYDTEHTSFETTIVLNMRVFIISHTVSHVCLCGNQAKRLI